jgi:class 3 adenylate cyclase
VLAGYFERMKAIVESHGGTVEKFIGDAVMAVFGVPVLHEDDALRAAVEMRDALPVLGLEGRIGVMTGEVVTGTEERLATGDAVNVAARLEQAAAPGEVLIGEPTLRLAREDCVPVETWLQERFDRFARERLLDGFAPYGIVRRAYLEELARPSKDAPPLRRGVKGLAAPLPGGVAAHRARAP